VTGRTRDEVAESEMKNVFDWLTDLTAKFQLALASTPILGSDPHGTDDHILLCDGTGSLLKDVTT
jgi:hypothetical protein